MAIVLDIRHLQISHNTPCLPPQFLHNLCFSFLLGITAVPREIQNNVMQIFFWVGGGGGGGQARCIVGDLRVPNGNWRSGPILAVLIHSLLRAPALFSLRLSSC